MPILFPIAALLGQSLLGTPSPVVGMLPLPATKLVISGVTRDSSSVALGGCTVKLFRTADDVLMETLVSDGGGNFSFSAVGLSETYYVVAYLPGSPDVAGTTLNTLVGT